MGVIGRTLGGIAVFCLAAWGTEVAANGVDAIWKPQQFTFSYYGMTSRYACSEFESRVRQILLALGAHENMQVDRRECSESAGMHLRITFMSPIEATPENVREVTTFDTEQQLIARLKGIDLPSEEDIARFPAEWQEISLSRDRRIGLRAGDCELLEQVRRQLLPLIATRALPKRLVCVQGNLSSRPPPLSVSALIASANPGR